MVKRKRILITATVSVAFEIANKIAPLIILHIANKRLGIEGFGYAQFSLYMMELALPFIAWGYTTMGAIEAGKSNDKVLSDLIWSITFARLLHALLAVVGLVAVTSLIGHYEAYRPAVFGLSFILFASAIDMQWVLVARQKLAIYSFVSGVCRLGSLAMIYFFVESAEDSILYAALTMSANAALSLFTVFKSSGYFGGLSRFKIRSARLAFNRAMPFAYVIIVTSFFERFDIILVEFLESTKSAGVYAGPLRIATSLLFIAGAITNTFFSEMVSVKGRESHKKHLDISLWIMVSLIAPVAVGVWFVDHEVLSLILGPTHDSQGSVFSIMVLGTAFYGLNGALSSQSLFIGGRARHYSIGVLISLALSLPISWVLHSKFGLMGIAAGACFGRFLILGVCAYLTKQTSGIEIWRPVLKYSYPAALMGLGLLLMDTNRASLTNTIVKAVGLYATIFTAFNWRRLSSYGKQVLEKLKPPR